jgi:hypothetical protein
MILELRFYQVTQGRIGDQNARLTQHLVPRLFPRHGVRCVGAWNSLAGPAGPRFVYLMAFDTFEQREQAWSSFYADPEWHRVRAETNAGHEMVERHDLFFVRAHACHPHGDAAVPAPGELHELVLQQLAPGEASGAQQFMQEVWLPRLRSSGARTLGVFEMVSGSGMQQVLMFHAWPDAASWHMGTVEAARAPEVLQSLGAQRARLGQAIFGRADVSLLQPVEGFLIHPTLGA